MKVAELIAILEDLEPEAEVYLMNQSSWPFECSIQGVAVREDFEDVADEDDDDDDEEPCAAPDDDGRCAADVFIVEGTQRRYGSKEAWSACRRG